jgi:hypothetical protein
LAEHTRVNPQKRASLIAEFARSLANDKSIQQELDMWQPTIPASGLCEVRIFNEHEIKSA